MNTTTIISLPIDEAATVIHGITDPARLLAIAEAAEAAYDEGRTSADPDELAALLVIADIAMSCRTARL